MNQEPNEDRLLELLRHYHSPPPPDEEHLWDGVRERRHAPAELPPLRAPQPRWVPSVAWAAGVLLMVGVAGASSVFAPDVPSRVMEMVGEAREAVTRPAPAERARAEPPAPIAAGRRIMAATLPGERLVVLIDHCQQEGMLIVERQSGQLAAIEVVQGGRDERLETAPGSLRVVNQQNSIATYRLTLPHSLLRAAIRFGDGEPLVVPGAAWSRTEWVFHLQDLTHGAEGHCSRASVPPDGP